MSKELKKGINKQEQILEITLKLKVPSIIVNSFTKDFVSRIHKYLLRHATTVYAVDSKIYDVQ